MLFKYTNNNLKDILADTKPSVFKCIHVDDKKIMLLLEKSLEGIGVALHSQGKHDEALKQHQQALSIRMEVLDPEHVDVATSLNNIASVLHAQGKHTEAL